MPRLTQGACQAALSCRKRRKTTANQRFALPQQQRGQSVLRALRGRRSVDNRTFGTCVVQVMWLGNIHPLPPKGRPNQGCGRALRGRRLAAVTASGIPNVLRWGQQGGRDISATLLSSLIFLPTKKNDQVREGASAITLDGCVCACPDREMVAAFLHTHGFSCRGGRRCPARCSPRRPAKAAGIRPGLHMVTACCQLFDRDP